MAKKIPLRKCIATNELLEKNQLLRIVKTPEGQIKIDPTGKLNGRGAYLKKTVEAVEIARQKNLLRRALGVDIDEQLYTDILNVITE